MAMVLEEESNMDQSSIMMSQSRVPSMSQHTSQPKRFVYDDTKHGNATAPQDLEDSDSDDSNENDMENDLLAFDKDQADAIRFFKGSSGGSMKSGSMQLDGSLAFLTSTQSPNTARRTMIPKANIDIGHHITT